METGILDKFEQIMGQYENPTMEELALYRTEREIIQLKEEQGVDISQGKGREYLEEFYQQMLNNGLTPTKEVHEIRVRSYEELVEYVNSYDIQSYNNNRDTHISPELSTEPTHSIADFSFSFDEEEGMNQEPSNVIINRRGSGEPIDAPALESGEQVSGEQVERNSGEPVGREHIHINMRPSEIDEDDIYVSRNFKMVSRFAYSGEVGSPRLTNTGDTMLNYAVCVLFTFADGREDDVFVAETFEHAIQQVESLNYRYNKGLNIFAKSGNSGQREYARIYIDVDLRGLLG